MKNEYNNENPDEDDGFRPGNGSSPPSLLNILVLYLTLLGIGAVGGYGLFYHLFQERCHVLVRETQNQHQVMKLDYEQQLSMAMEGQRLCLADSKTKQELSVLQGRLEAQSNLVDRHSELLEKYDHGQAEILNLRKQLRDVRASYTEVQSRSEQLTKESVQVQLERNDLNKRVQQQEVRLHHMQGQVEECMTRTIPKLQEQTKSLKEYMYSQHYTQALQKFGTGPYQVQFTLNFPTTMSSEPNTFVVECFPLEDMPHTIYTFLDLVVWNLYDETVFSSVVPSITTTTSTTSTTTTTIMSIEGGNPTSAIHAGRLHQRYVQAGYRNRSPLGFNEYDETKHPISKMTIGFTSTGGGGGGSGTTLIGPGLVLYTNDGTTATTPTNIAANHADKPLPPPVFGRITSGIETLERIVNAPKAVDGKRLAMNVEIQSVRLLGFHKEEDEEEEDMQEDEVDQQEPEL